ncbi:uncharacterized protein LOC143910788 [Arctopsyche grandis]|uniref:uncharacterized protein LOC143910788 n=1 Tax=Arctopsyche grandis TaxID=121162 RepID=UPI00406D724A
MTARPSFDSRLSDTASLTELIQEELRQIVRIQHLVLTELDKLNDLIKPNGCLDVAVTEGTRSAEMTAAIAKISLKEEILRNFKNLTNEINVDGLLMESQLE